MLALGDGMACMLSNGEGAIVTAPLPGDIVDDISEDEGAFILLPTESNVSDVDDGVTLVTTFGLSVLPSSPLVEKDGVTTASSINVVSVCNCGEGVEDCS